MKTYTLYLSTLTANGKYVPTSKSNLANVKWNINWKEIFGSRNGECRVRVRMLSSSQQSISWNNNCGSIRATFSSNSSNSTNGFNLGYVRAQSDYTTAQAQTTYLDSDTLTSNGASIIIPNSNGDFSITLLDRAEAFMTNVPEYQIWFYFDVDDENPSVSNEALPKYFNPR